MPSSKEYLEFVTDTISAAGNMTCRKMMGEYLIYLNGVLIGGVYDDRFLLKVTPSNEGCGLDRQLPYEGAKLMYTLDVEQENALEIILNAYNDLK